MLASRTTLNFAAPSTPPSDDEASCEVPRGSPPTMLDELARYDVLDTPREEAFDRVTRLVRHIFSVKMASVTFLDGHRQWFKSRQGLASAETARDISFCRIPVAENRLLVVPDTLDDDRFRDNPLVVGPPSLRFYAGAPLHGSSGLCIGTLCAMDTRPRAFGNAEIDILLDLARIVETELELRILATTDSLTGLLARRAFLEEGERALNLAHRHRYDLSCVSFDLDGFKAINDSAGHAAGDAVLAATAKTCTSLLRKSDLIGRLGGEEFSVLLPHADAAQAAAIAEKLRAKIERQASISLLPLHPVTASFGVASLPSAPIDLATLLAAADEALYVAKSRGRNCCILGPTLAPHSPLGRKVLKPGAIVFNFGNSVIDCTVRRLSDTGARLDVLSLQDIPRQFKLSIEVDSFSKSCEIVGKEGRSLDVVFR
jgi:diguanylate cyclase (GGDEF)-like protein